MAIGTDEDLVAAMRVSDDPQAVYETAKESGAISRSNWPDEITREGAGDVYNDMEDDGGEDEPDERLPMELLSNGERQHGRSAEAFKAAVVLGRSRPLVELLKALEVKQPGAEEGLAHLTSFALGRLTMLANARKSSPRVRRRILRGLRRCDLPECVDVASQGLEDDDVAVRETAVRTLLHKAREGDIHVPRKPVERALNTALERFRLYVHARPPYPSDVRESSIAFRHDAALVLDAEVFFLDELERSTEHSLSEVCELLALLGNPNQIYKDRPRAARTYSQTPIAGRGYSARGGQQGHGAPSYSPCSSAIYSPKGPRNRIARLCVS